MKLSIVVPVFNEKDNVMELHRQIVAICKKIGEDFEIIFVDDGSIDGTTEKCRKLQPLKLIELRKNFGQTAGFDAGIKIATGEIIITMDGDLQNDPADIPLLLAEMKKGYDVVSGWRWQRKDSLSKKIFSRGADFLRKILLHDNIHDSGCSLKAYKRECFVDINLFGEMHRFIPAIVAIQGFRIGEVKVSHHPRIHGVTKYNWRRSVKGFVDMISVWFWGKFANRPLHLFGSLGFFLSLAGVGIMTWLLIERIIYQIPLQGRIWPLIGIFFFLIGVQLFVSGLLADIMIKSYFSGKKNLNYSIKKITKNE